MKKLSLSQIFELLAEVQSIFDGDVEMRDWRGPEHLEIETDDAGLAQVVLEMDTSSKIDGMIDPDYEVTLQELLDAEVKGNTLVVKTTKYRMDTTRWKGGKPAGRDPVTLNLRFMRVVKTPITLATLCAV